MPPRAQNQIEIHLLDVGEKPYGDCTLCRFGDLTVLIDGGHKGDQDSSADHRSIPGQLASLLSQPPERLHVDLLIVTHTHADHFGCLPLLVEQGRLTADWCLLADPDLGWGVTPETSDLISDSAIDPRIRLLLEASRDDSDPELLMEALRNDSDPRSPGRSISDLLADAVKDGDRYRSFVNTLGHNGKVVLYDKGPLPEGGKDLRKLLKHFSERGLVIDIPGPSRSQLTECAKGLAATLQAIRADAENRLASDAMRSVDSLLADFAREPSRGGNFVNLQSIVTIFTFARRKFLFTGDLQSEDPTTQWNRVPVSPELTSELDLLRKAIIGHAPYDFVKMGHHGSHNAFSAGFLDSLKGTVLFGISLGARSQCHPDETRVLPLLRERSKSIQWLRTDLNRLSSFVFNRFGVVYEKEAGWINDKRPNPAGCPVSGGEVFTSGAPVLASPGKSNRSQPLRTAPMNTRGIPDLQVGGGVALPKLLFVTSREQLRLNVGKDDCDAALAAVLKAGGILLDDLPAAATPSQFDESVQRVQEAAAKDAGIRGIVLVGGYDVVPCEIRDALPEVLRPGRLRSLDFDEWTVWSDDDYGARLNDGKLVYFSLPVSRVPDARSAQLLFAGLQSGNHGIASSYAGIRNIMRPFAAKIRGEFRDGNPLLISSPTTHSTGYNLTGRYIYLMLHGLSRDLETSEETLLAKNFYGEENGDYISAMAPDNVPANCAGSVILAGCCWGALISSESARTHGDPSWPVDPKTGDQSIALRFLLNGASAFIGCTGAHYSIGNNPNKAGPAMHRAFLKHLLDRSLGPAEALMKAKADFRKAIPHGFDPNEGRSVAAEWKTLYQFTCLGLGW